MFLVDSLVIFVSFVERKSKISEKVSQLIFNLTCFVQFFLQCFNMISGKCTVILRGLE